MNRKLYRDTNHKILGGVASGLAEYMNTDVSIIRILFIITGFWHHFFGPVALLAYILLWIIVPDKNKIIQSPNGFMAGPPDPNPSDFEVNYQVDENGKAIPHFKGSDSMNPELVHTNRQRNQIGGIILVIVGSLILVQEYVDWDFRFFDRFWPAGLIILGIVLVISTTQTKNQTK